MIRVLNCGCGAATIIETSNKLELAALAKLR